MKYLLCTCASHGVGMASGVTARFWPVSCRFLLRVLFYRIFSPFDKFILNPYWLIRYHRPIYCQNTTTFSPQKIYGWWKGVIVIFRPIFQRILVGFNTCQEKVVNNHLRQIPQAALAAIDLIETSAMLHTLNLLGCLALDSDLDVLIRDF